MPRLTTRLTQTRLTSPLASVANDTQLIALWLHGKSHNTQKAYQHDIRCCFQQMPKKSLQSITLNDLQSFATHLQTQGYSTATQRRRINTVKSLLSYGHDLGVLSWNVGKLVKPPKVKNTLAERILSERQVLHLIASEPHLRNRVLLRFLYATGARVSEVCALQWRDLQPTRKGRGQVTFLGKGSKTRAVIFSRTTWSEVQSLQRTAGLNNPVFQSRLGGHLDRSQVQRILAAAAKRVGILAQVSPHWLRHAHASHSLERGTPISVVQATLGHASVATTGIYLHVRPYDSSALHLAV